MNHYLNVFLEAAQTASLIPFSSETTFFAMKAFGGYHMPAAAMLAATGGVSMQMINHFIGAWVFKQRPKDGWHIADTAYEKARRLFNKYGVFLLLFSWAMLGNVLVLVSGFLGTRTKTVLPLILVGYVAYYGYQVL